MCLIALCVFQVCSKRHTCIPGFWWVAAVGVVMHSWVVSSKSFREDCGQFRWRTPFQRGMCGSGCYRTPEPRFLSRYWSSLTLQQLDSWRRKPLAGHLEEGMRRHLSLMYLLRELCPSLDRRFSGMHSWWMRSWGRWRRVRDPLAIGIECHFVVVRAGVLLSHWSLVCS